MSRVKPRIQGRRRSAIAALAAAAALLAGCGGPGNVTRTVEDAPLAGAVVGETVSIAGTLARRGSTPFTTLVVETAGGHTVVCQSRTLQDELARLGGMRVAVEGEVLPSIDGETPVVNVVRYRLLRLETGEQPLVGVLAVGPAGSVFEATDGRRFWIVGDFADLLRDFDGAKVWVVGTQEGRVPAAAPEGVTAYRVTGYGLLADR